MEWDERITPDSVVGAYPGTRSLMPPTPGAPGESRSKDAPLAGPMEVLHRLLFDLNGQAGSDIVMMVGTSLAMGRAYPAAEGGQDACESAPKRTGGDGCKAHHVPRGREASGFSAP